MATRTPTELAANVLLHLGVVASDATPSAADSSYVIKRYQDLYEELADPDEHIVYWDQDAIPRVVFEPLTQLVALTVSTPFGFPVTPQQLEAGIEIFKRRLRRHTHKRPAELPVEVDDF